MAARDIEQVISRLLREIGPEFTLELSTDWFEATCLEDTSRRIPRICIRAIQESQ